MEVGARFSNTPIKIRNTILKTEQTTIVSAQRADGHLI